MKRISALAIGIFFAVSPGIAPAFDEPAVNLGGTSFLDGGPPAGPGWYFLEYLQWYSANRLNDGNGQRLPLPQTQVRVTAAITQLVYISPDKIGSANWGIQTILPAVLSASVDDGLGNAVLKANSGVGDLVVGPFLQFDPIMGPNGPRFVQRVEASFILPTGDYNRTNAVNPGSNFWSFNPYWAGTYWASPEWSASLRFHYLWNAKNKDPNVSFGPGVSSTQAGQALHANFATEYAVTPQFRLGLNGYWLRQLDDTKANGIGVPGSREQVWAIGPGAVYSFSKDDHIFLNTYVERDARNRAEGNRVLLRYAHHF